MMLPFQFFVFGIAIILFMEYLFPMVGHIILFKEPDFNLPHRNTSSFFKYYTWFVLVYFAFAFFTKQDTKKVLLFIVSASIIGYFSLPYLALYIVFITLLHFLLFRRIPYRLKLTLFIIYLIFCGLASIAVVFLMRRQGLQTLVIMLFLNSLGKKSIYLFYEVISEKITKMGLMDCIFYLTFLPFTFPALPVSPSEFFKGFKPHRRHPIDKVFLHGAGSVAWGACKIAINLLVMHKLLLVVNFGRMFDVMHTLSIAEVWGIVLLNYILWYFYLSGLYGVSLGIANMCGIRIRPNFINPMFARDPLDLWKRWNIHYRGWLLRVFYFPIWWKYKITYLNVLIVFIISALSHTFTSLFKTEFAWGEFIYFIVQAFGVMFIMLLKRGSEVGGDVEKGGMFRVKTILSIAATYVYMSLVHVLLFAYFNGLSLGDTWDIYAKLFGAG